MSPGIGFGDKITIGGLTLSPGPSTMQADGGKFVASLRDYRQIKKMGSGAHGEVWKVQSISRGSSAAMKQIELGLASKKKVQQIMRELNVLKKARGNPYIVDLHGVFYSKHVFYIVMQYMNAGSLETLLSQHKMRHERDHPGTRFPGVPLDAISVIGASALQGLKYLKEELNVMHRDIKPSNILANSKGSVKICDFSICAEFQSNQYAETYIGTVYYMAPERINPRKDKGYNPTADIWSVGVTLVELATGEYPYPKEGIFAMLQHIVKGPSPVEKDGFTRMNFPANFINFCTLCLHKIADDRPGHDVLLDHPFAQAGASAKVICSWLQCITKTAARKKPQSPAPPPLDQTPTPSRRSSADD